MTKSLRILLTRLIDYAGSFPPAGLPLSVSMDNFLEYQKSPHAWILNRFILPAAGLEDFLRYFENLPRPSTWRLSVIVGKDADSDLSSIVEFNRRFSEAALPAVIESIEMKGTDSLAMGQYAGLLPRSFELYFEIPGTAISEGFAAPLAKAGARAKLRTGGETAAAFPSCAQVAHFLADCAAENVPFKCSAGLHHPVRSVHPYTYDRKSPKGTMHGFLNVFVAAAFARKGMRVEAIEKMLAEESPKAFEFSESGVSWRGNGVTTEELSSSRSSLCISFGSCSFTEPVDDLSALGLL